MTYSEDHFYKQFDRYPEGQERFKAVARHAAMLLNANDAQKAEERDALVRIRNAMIAGTNPVKIALAIQERLEDKFDTGADCPSIDELLADAAKEE